jgi:hypothetical protein
MLVPLAKPHLDHRGQARLADQDAFNTGLAWATRDINPNVALLQPGGTDIYIINDYALDLISAQDTPIPDSSWAAIMSNADTPELILLGYTAQVIYHRNEIAARSWGKATSSGHADAAPTAVVRLGALLAEQGDVAGAKDAYQKAIGSGHAEMALRAAVSLGALLAEHPDMPGA